MRLLSLLLVLHLTPLAVADGPAKAPVHLWLEPEWFDGVQGSFAYWTGNAKATGAWGVAGPGISAEWSQGGESEWNSLGAAPDETKAECGRDFVIPRTGSYHVWVRYVDHRKKSEPFQVCVDQKGGGVKGVLGEADVVPVNDEYQLFWGFSFGWARLPEPAKFTEGPAKVRLIIDKTGDAWRQVDALLITDDLTYVPTGREKPPFAYQAEFASRPADGATWRGSAKGLPSGPFGKRQERGGRDFTMWTGIEPDAKWWAKQELGKLSAYDVMFEYAPPRDIKDKFHKQFAGRTDLPIVSWPGLRPGFHLGASPDLSPESPVRMWLERTKAPFYIMTNYATGKYTDKTGPATYTALTGPLKAQFLGYIHGEAIGTQGLSWPKEQDGADRRSVADSLARHWKKQQAEAWSKIYKTEVPEDHWDRGISCLSVDSIALAHLFAEMGARTLGYEIDATNVHASMRIAFLRGAARQYQRAWINYASGNFGDACNYFSQQPVVPRGAGSWFHSKYAITDGVSISWYRKLYYMNYLGGASALYWEQNLANQWILPGPGTHPVQLSPFGRATEDFQAFVDRLPDRGEPLTPVAVLLSHGHGYERVNYRCKMLHHFAEDVHDRELRELFNVLWHPSGRLEGQPASPDVQSMPSGVFGDIFDVLVDRPGRTRAMMHYPVVWAAGDTNLAGDNVKVVEEYLGKGGTLVVSLPNAAQFSEKWLGFRPTKIAHRAETWSTDGATFKAATPYDAIQVGASTATPLAWAAKDRPLVLRNQVGAGAVVTILTPHGLGLDERAHPVLPFVMNGLTEKLLPIDVRVKGQHPGGEIAWQINKTPTGYVVALYNHQGIDKTQTGIARVDRRQAVEVTLHCHEAVKACMEWTTPRKLEPGGEPGAYRLTVPVGDVSAVEFVLAK